jgi:hypothetical protein
MSSADHVARIVEIKNSYNRPTLVEKPQGKIPLENPKHRWEDNIKMNLELDVRVLIGFHWFGIGSSEESCEHLKKSLGSTKIGRNFFS